MVVLAFVEHFAEPYANLIPLTNIACRAGKNV